MLIDSHLLQKSFVFKIRKILREKKNDICSSKQFLNWSVLHFKWKKSKKSLSVNKSRQQKHVRRKDNEITVFEGLVIPYMVQQFEVTRLWV